jgi:hypothetical protein
MAPNDQSALVAVIKQRLEDRGVNLSGPDGAFEITRRVAWELRDQGAGLLSKTSGNNSHGFAVDIVCFRDGTYADCLVKAGDANQPAWQINPGVIDVSRWTAPSDPGDEDVKPQPPQPDPAPPPEPDDWGSELAQQLLEVAGALVNAVEQLAHATIELRDRLDNIGKSGVRVHL